ncbi:MAG: glucose-6-phosphate dehydrogenase [Candidatus Saccharibacteria bacterium]
MADAITPGRLLDSSPSSLVIFGITGDLASRKVLPALYHLLKDNLLPADFEIIGTSRKALTIDELLKDVELCNLEDNNVCDPGALRAFREHLRIIQLDPASGEGYNQLRQTLDDIETAHGVCMNRLYYLSIPPQVYGSVVRSLGEHGLNQGCQHGSAESRLLVEKPFGYDYTSAEELIATTATTFEENQIFRIDHYLAKESAQNILTFRQHNPLFASIWDNRHITSIDIVAFEKIGIAGRANFYEHIGALRDLIQSHLMQLLALTTMELPKQIGNIAAIHAAKKTLLDAIVPPAANNVTDDVVRAQYEGYREEVDNQSSVTETFVSMQLSIENDRWHGVPMTLATGKAVAQKRTDITISFGHAGTDAANNQLTFRIQPNEGIDVQLLVKKPGFDDVVHPASMDFSYVATFVGDHGHPDAYERVLVDAIRGDHTLFATSQEVLASWRILQPVLDHWTKDDSDLLTYPTGSKGPVRP